MISVTYFLHLILSFARAAISPWKMLEIRLEDPHERD